MIINSTLLYKYEMTEGKLTSSARAPPVWVPRPAGITSRGRGAVKGHGHHSHLHHSHSHSQSHHTRARGPGRAQGVVALRPVRSLYRIEQPPFPSCSGLLVLDVSWQSRWQPAPCSCTLHLHAAPLHPKSCGPVIWTLYSAPLYPCTPASCTPYPWVPAFCILPSSDHMCPWRKISME